MVMLTEASTNPADLSVWGIVNGITSSAKAHRYAEDRTRVGALAGRILTAALWAKGVPCTLSLPR